MCLPGTKENWGVVSRGALDRHARISTLSGSSWTTVILGGGGSETPDRCVGGPRQDETK